MRAQMYSLVALLIAVPVFIFLTFYMASVQTPSSVALDKVVSDQIHGIEKGMEEDFARAMNIAGRRALLTMLMEMTDTGVYTSNADEFVKELMLNGSLDGNETPIMYGNTLPEWESRLLGVGTAFTKSFSYELFSVNRSSGFDLLANAHIIVNVTGDDVRIDREFTDDFVIPLADIEDPVYLVETAGRVSRSIKPYGYAYYVSKIATGTANSSCFGNASFEPGSPNTNRILVTDDASGLSGFAGIVSETGTPNQDCFITGIAGAVDLVNQTISLVGYDGLVIDESGLWSAPFRDGLENGKYFSGFGVGIINRLDGNLTPDADGIVSFVNTDDIALTGLTIKENQTRTDYLYFSDEIVNGKTVRGMPEWFRIDDETAARFGLTELVNP
ncbi:MAG: hypothetical protein ABIH90_02480 [Candidatus Aenigmatarchaeota archaeon]